MAKKPAAAPRRQRKPSKPSPEVIARRNAVRRKTRPSRTLAPEDREPPRAMDHRKPEVFVAVIDRLRQRDLAGTDGETLGQIATDLGISKDAVSKLQKKLQREYLPLKRALGEVQRDELRDVFNYRAMEFLEAITPEDVLKMRGDQKVLAAAIATDKALLLDRQPTQIISIPEARNLNELSGLLLREIERRNGTADADPITGKVCVTHGLLDRTVPRERPIEESGP